MINILIFLTSFLIQFGVISYGEVAPNYQYIVDDIQAYLASGNSWQQSYALTPDEYWIVYRLEDGTYRAFIPRELPEPSFSSSVLVNSLINDVGLNVTFYNYVLMNYNGSTVGFEWPSSYDFSFYYYNADDSYHPRLLYVGQDSFYYDGEYQVTLTIASPPNLKQDHASGWSSLIEETEDGTFTVFGHSNGAITNENSFWLVDSTSQLTDKLLTGIGNLLSGISDTLSYGLGEIKNYLVNFYSWATDPLDTEHFTLMLNSSILGPLLNLDLDFKNHIPESQDIIISWDLSNVQYFGGASGSINLSHKLNPSKNIWQPLLLTFLYAATVWGLFKSIPNIFGGVSPLAENPKHEQKKGGKKP